MAISFVSSVRSMAANLVAAIQGSPSSSAPHHGVKRDLEKLTRTLQRIQAVLHDAEEREIRDESVKLWLKELKGVAYDAEDVIDDYHYDVLKSQAESGADPKKKPEDEPELNALQDNLKEELKGKRTLLVVDDVWNEQQNPWDSLRVPFASAETVRVMVTTRNDSVAKIMQTMPTYQLGLLPEKQCWDLFQRHAFDGRDPTMQPDLIEIGKKIVRKCGRLPLALKALGGLLRFETDEDRWEEVLESNLWDLDETKYEIFPALRLSYQRMPARLKPCFLYSSMFPKDYLFKKDQLVNLWVAQGYVQSRGSKSVQDIGCEYFDELQRRSFFQAAGNYRWDPAFQMHDMIHDLACSISGDECCTVTLKDDEVACDISNQVRHLYVENLRTMDSLPFNKLMALRTLMVMENTLKVLTTYDHLFFNLGCLRALKLSSKEWPEPVSNLRHLRYLSLSSPVDIRVTESVSHLYNLQILDLKGCAFGLELPGHIANLANLSQLLLPDNVCMPPGIGKLTNLQELSTFNVVRSRRHWVSMREMKGLVRLSGGLQIRGLRNVVSAEEVKEANLRSKQWLTKLSLVWDGGCCEHGAHGYGDEVINIKAAEQDDKYKLEEAVLDNLWPSTNLRELTIQDYGGSRFPRWVGDPLFSKLTRVDISNCPQCKFLPPLGELPSLKFLTVSKMNGVTRVGREFCTTSVGKVGFPSLEELAFDDMSAWEQWCSDLGADFPRLQRLHIGFCLKLTTIPALPSLNSLEISHCNRLESLPLLQDNPGCASMLQILRISYCSGLISLVGLHNLEFLEELNINDCQKLQSLGMLPRKLERLFIRRCMNITTVSGLQMSSVDQECLPSKLETLDISRCWKLSSLSGLKSLPSLQRLVLKACPELKLFPDERLSTTPHHVEIVDCPGLREWCNTNELPYTQESSTPTEVALSYMGMIALEHGAYKLWQ